MSSRTSGSRGRRAVLTVLVSLCAVPAVLASTGANAFASPPTFLGSFNPFERPTGMAVEESTGNVFVPVSGEDFDQVRVFGKNGGAPAGGAPAAFSDDGASFAFEGEWVGIAVDNSTSSAAGSVYVVDRGHKVVDRFKLIGGEYKFESSPQLTGAPFAEPEGVATDGDGDVYVSDRGSGTGGAVREFSPAGAEIASFPAKGLERSVSVDTRGDIFLYGNPTDAGHPSGFWSGARPTEIRRSSTTATSAESVDEVPEVEGAIADTIDRATDRGYVAIHGRVVEGVASPNPMRTGVEFGAGTFSNAIEGIALNEKTGAIYVGDAGEEFGKQRVFIFQGAPSRFPVTVSIAGEGEVTSTPAGIACPATQCTHEFEGEVELTATAGAGYEFAGWIGCTPIAPAPPTTCRVDRAVTTSVTATFLKAGKQGSTGPAGPAGPTGPAGEKGTSGTSGSAGPQGPTGAQGPAGPAGKVVVVTCRTVKGKQRCTAKLVSGTVKFTTTGQSARATLSRHGLVYATGTARIARGHTSLRLLPAHSLRPGRYTLTLISGTGRHKRISTQPFTLR